MKQPDQSVGKILNEFFKAVFATNSGLWVGNHDMHLPWRTPLDTDSWDVLNHQLAINLFVKTLLLDGWDWNPIGVVYSPFFLALLALSRCSSPFAVFWAFFGAPLDEFPWPTRKIVSVFLPQLMAVLGHGVLHSCELMLPLGTTRCDCAVSQAVRDGTWALKRHDNKGGR